MKNPTMKTLLTEWRNLLKEGDHAGHVSFFRPDGEPTQQEHAILQHYGDGSMAKKTIGILEKISIDKELMIKKFND